MLGLDPVCHSPALAVSEEVKCSVFGLAQLGLIMTKSRKSCSGKEVENHCLQAVAFIV